VPSQQSSQSSQQQQQQQQQSIAEDEEWAASEHRIAAAATAAGISTYSTATTARSAAAANEAARLRRYDEQSHDEGPLAYVHRRSSQLWCFFPHVELVFLLAAIEGATAAQVIVFTDLTESLYL
jgi:hypothetical protein